MKSQSNIKVRIPKALFELYKKENSKIDSKGVLREMLKNQLKGMIAEATEETPAGLVNTSDEKNLQKAVDKNPTVKQYLGKIGSTNELDGALETIISQFGLQNMPKNSIISALKSALNSLAPNDNNVSSSLKEGVKKVIRIKKKK
jgi:uncharacterized membrane-anchored protein